MQSGEEIRIALRDSLRGNASEATWAAGLNTLHLVDYHDKQLVIGAPNQIQLQRIQQRFLPFITEQAQQLVGADVTVSLTVSDTPSATDNEPVDDSSNSSTPAMTFSPSVDRPARLDPRMTFDSFVPGSSNRLAFAAAQSVAETPGRAYNPLMIYGNSGLGKTHLLHAIGNYVQENYPGRKVLYVSTETFLNDFIRAIQTRTQLALHDRYRENDVLLIDDIQFMETRGETFHEEIFHTYNALHGEGKQIVLTSDRSPRDLRVFRNDFEADSFKVSLRRLTNQTLRHESRFFVRRPNVKELLYQATSLSGSPNGCVTTFESSRDRSPCCERSPICVKNQFHWNSRSTT